LFTKGSLAVSLHYFAPLSHFPMHIDIANGGFDGPTAHGIVSEIGADQADPVLMREVNWRDAVHRVFSRRRNAIARGLQRLACAFEVWLGMRFAGQTA
jgi:hypothetical protein